MRCQYYEGRKVRCEAKATKAVYLRQERLGRVCDKHAESLTSRHPRRLSAKPLSAAHAAA